MAEKRLNRKVALIGSAVFLLLALGVVVVVLHLSRDPEKYIQDGDAAWIAQDYDRADRNYREALNLVKDDQLSKEILFKLADVYIKTDEWPKVRGCWAQIITIDPENIEARLGQLKYLYIFAGSYAGAGQNVSRIWEDIRKQASELIEVVDNAGLLREDKTKWEPSFGPEARELKRPGVRIIGPYLYLLRSIAAIGLAEMRAVSVPGELLASARSDLEKVLEMDSDNVDAYWYLAQVEVEEGNIRVLRGSLEEGDRADERAVELLEKAVELADADPIAHINLLLKKLELARRRGDVPVRQRVQALEPEYLSLVGKFPDNADAFAALAGFHSIHSFYSGYQFGLEIMDKGIDAIEKAIALDRENVAYAMTAASLYYRRFSVYGQTGGVYKAIAIAKRALTLPNAQATSGPRSYMNKVNRVSLCSLLAHCYIEQILEPCEVRTESEAKMWLTSAEEAVHEIEQIFGSGEEPHVVKWQGMLELAKGNTNLAVRKLYAAYEELKAGKPSEPPWPMDIEFARLSYTLAKIFKNTPELGMAAEFMVSAIQSGIEATKPEAILDNLEVVGKLQMWQHVISPVNPYSVDAFERSFGSSQRSRTLRIKALIGTNQISEAEEELVKLDSDDLGTTKLNLELTRAKIAQIQIALGQKRVKDSTAVIVDGVEVVGRQEVLEPDDSVSLMRTELNNYRQIEAELVQKLMLKEPSFVGENSVSNVCRYYIEQDQASEARKLTDQFAKYAPDSITVSFFKQLLSEPDPKNVSQERQKEIRKQVLSDIADPVRRGVQFGLFYQRNDEPDKATEEFKKVIKTVTSQEAVLKKPAYGQVEEISQQYIAASRLFEIAVGAKNWSLAEQAVDVIQRGNLDGCGSQFFAARLSAARGDYKDAMKKINDCLKQRPIFSRAYMLRSNINAALGNEHESMEDIRKASYSNPLDGVVARGLANSLFRRNQKLGDNVPFDQLIETKSALERAIRLNPGDLDLISAYAEYISQTEPLRALAIRQNLQAAAPSLQNAVLLARLATNMAEEERIPERKEVLFRIAESSLEQAKSISPNDSVVLEAYAQYLRARGQNQEAEQLLQESEDQALLWRHYFRLGQFDEAKKLLEQLYKQQPKDTDTVKGLLLVAGKINDKEAVKKYSDELIVLENNVDNHLEQILTFLGVGLVKEAEYKLQSFKEKYPDESAVLLLEGWLGMKQGQLEKALERTNQFLQDNQDHAAAWRLRGEINLLLANYDQAIKDLNKSKSLMDVSPTRIALAKAYLQIERGDDAIIELKNAISEQDAPLEARMLLEYIYISLDRREALRSFYDETLEKFPTDVRWCNRAGTFAMNAGEFDRAERLYKKAYLLKAKAYQGKDAQSRMNDMQYAAALDGYLQALVSGAGTPNAANGVWNPNKLDSVFKEGEKYVDTDFAPIAFFRMAEAKLKLGDKKSAVEYCRKAVDKAQTNERLASEILLRMFLLLGDEEVSNYCRQKLQTEPDSLAANFTMFNLAKVKADYKNAITYIDKCIQLAGQDNASQVSYILRKAQLLTSAYERTSDNSYLEKAIADYQSLLDKMPNNTEVLNNLAYMLTENKERLSEAYEYAKRAIEQQPNNPSFLDTYAYVLHKSGKNAEAVEFLTASLQQYEQGEVVAPPEVYEHLGMVREELGDKAQALVAYKRALEVGEGKLPMVIKERVESAIERLSR